jgi:hypothetical protein
LTTFTSDRKPIGFSGIEQGSGGTFVPQTLESASLGCLYSPSCLEEVFSATRLFGIRGSRKLSCLFILGTPEIAVQLIADNAV